MTNRRACSSIGAGALALLLASAPSSAQTLIQRCDPPLAAAAELLKIAVDCSAALSFGGPGEAALMERVRTFNRISVYLPANPCAKLIPAADGGALAECTAYFAGLQKGPLACAAFPPHSAPLCRDAAAYARAAKSGDAAVCGASVRCRALMGAAAPPAPRIQPNSRGFVCQVPIDADANRKLMASALSSVQLCLSDVDAVLSAPEPAAAVAFDARVEKLARLRLQAEELFPGVSSAAAAPGHAPGSGVR